jgi:hypothetical protein
MREDCWRYSYSFSSTWKKLCSNLTTKKHMSYYPKLIVPVQMILNGQEMLLTKKK